MTSRIPAVTALVWRPSRIDASSPTRLGGVETLPNATLFSIEWVGGRLAYRLNCRLPGMKKRPGPDEGRFVSREAAQEYAEGVLRQYVARLSKALAAVESPEIPEIPEAPRPTDICPSCGNSREQSPSIPTHDYPDVPRCEQQQWHYCREGYPPCTRPFGHSPYDGVGHTATETAS